MKKTALITGSSRGIGRAVALRLAKDGFSVIVHGARPSEKLSETARLIRAAGGEAAEAAFDLTDPAGARAAMERLGDVDVLVLNASLQIRRPWREIDLEECRDQLNCNFVSSLQLIQAAAPRMTEKKWGRIIAIGSVQEVKPHPDMLVYSASKSALENMVRSLSLQLAPFGVTVNNVAPGVINTDRNRDALADPVYAEKVIEGIPLGRYGQPEDLAGIVSLLASDDGAYITGQTLYVDGGKSIL
ncbi:MAG: SDR family oxidoreductase [Clostridia bacterium]|nr:SDR family oxidoreductase [Clostridia bacterium]